MRASFFVTRFISFFIFLFLLLI